ncbi:hypothetical protein ACTFIZ_008774 [Dictyostelium cf. discoideum]
MSNIKDNVFINRNLKIFSSNIDSVMDSKQFNSSQYPFLPEVYKIFAVQSSGNCSYNFSLDSQTIDLIAPQIESFQTNGINCFKNRDPSLGDLPNIGQKFIQIRIFNPKSGHDHSYTKSLKLEFNGIKLVSSKRKFLKIQSKNNYQSPADITDIVINSLKNNDDNNFNNFLISVKLPKSAILVVQLVAYVSPEKIADGKVRAFNYTNKTQVTHNDLNENEKLSVCCPIHMIQIRIPVKFKKCKHDQCFEMVSFLKYAITNRYWGCPICKKHFIFSDLEYDILFLDFCEKKRIVLGKFDKIWSPPHVSNKSFVLPKPNEFNLTTQEKRN